MWSRLETSSIPLGDEIPSADARLVQWDRKWVEGFHPTWSHLLEFSSGQPVGQARSRVERSAANSEQAVPEVPKSLRQVFVHVKPRLRERLRRRSEGTGSQGAAGHDRTLHPNYLLTVLSLAPDGAITVSNSPTSSPHRTYARLRPTAPPEARFHRAARSVPYYARRRPHHAQDRPTACRA